MRIPVKITISAALLAAAATLGAFAASAAEPGTTVAKVNGQEITNGELRFAEAEIGSELAGVPAESRRRVLVEYLVEAHLWPRPPRRRNSGPAPISTPA